MFRPPHLGARRHAPPHRPQTAPTPPRRPLPAAGDGGPHRDGTGHLGHASAATSSPPPASDLDHRRAHDAGAPRRPWLHDLVARPVLRLRAFDRCLEAASLSMLRRGRATLPHAGDRGRRALRSRWALTTCCAPACRAWDGRPPLYRRLPPSLRLPPRVKARGSRRLRKEAARPRAAEAARVSPSRWDRQPGTAAAARARARALVAAPPVAALSWPAASWPEPLRLAAWRRRRPRSAELLLRDRLRLRRPVHVPQVVLQLADLLLPVVHEGLELARPSARRRSWASSCPAERLRILEPVEDPRALEAVGRQRQVGPPVAWIGVGLGSCRRPGGTSCTAAPEGSWPPSAAPGHLDVGVDAEGPGLSARAANQRASAMRLLGREAEGWHAHVDVRAHDVGLSRNSKSQSGLTLAPSPRSTGGRIAAGR